MNLDKHEHYASIIDQYKDLAYSIAFKITKNEQDSEEIVQDSFIKAFQNLHKFRNESKFSSWFYRIVFNTAISATRKKRIQTIGINKELIDSRENVNMNIIQDLNYQDRKHILKKGLEKLDALNFAVITLFYYESKSLKEIAEITGKDRNYLKVLLQRARKKLLNVLSDSDKLELKKLL
tara:strand:+ start:3805 stop:4341 length:537 start_codon:yes stop_codon:yes gene_type:complete